MNVPSIELAAKSIDLAPSSFSRVFYSDSGAESVEFEIKIAYQYWQNEGQQKKTKLVTLSNSYHGDSYTCNQLGCAASLANLKICARKRHM